MSFLGTLVDIKVVDMMYLMHLCVMQVVELLFWLNLNDVENRKFAVNPGCPPLSVTVISNEILMISL